MHLDYSKKRYPLFTLEEMCYSSWLHLNVLMSIKEYREFISPKQNFSLKINVLLQLPIMNFRNRVVTLYFCIPDLTILILLSSLAPHSTPTSISTWRPVGRLHRRQYKKIKTECISQYFKNIIHTTHHYTSPSKMIQWKDDFLVRVLFYTLAYQWSLVYLLIEQTAQHSGLDFFVRLG